MTYTLSKLRVISFCLVINNIASDYHSVQFLSLTGRRSEWMTERWSEWMTVRWSEWMTERQNEWMTVRRSEWRTERQNEWMTVRRSKWMTERRSEWRTERRSEWMMEWLSEWSTYNFIEELRFVSFVLIQGWGFAMLSLFAEHLWKLNDQLENIFSGKSVSFDGRIRISFFL